MKIKIFIILLVISTNLFGFFNFFESEQVSHLKKEIEKDYNNVDLHIQLSNEYYNEFLKSKDKNSIENAYSEIKIAQSLNPMDLKLVSMCYEIGFNLVKETKKQEFLNELKTYFDILINANMNIAPISYLESIITPYNEENFTKHIILLKKALKDNYKFVDTYNLLSSVYIDTKKYDLALQIARMGTKLAPNYYRFYLTQATALQGKIDNNEQNNNCDLFNDKQNEEIIKLLQKAIKLNTQDTTYMRHMLSTIYKRTGKNKLSIFLIKQLVEQDPKNQDNLLQLIENYTEDLQIDKSKELLATITPKDSELLNWYNSEYATIYILERDWNKASEYFKKFLDGSKTDNFYRYFTYSIITNPKNINSFKELDNLPKYVKVNDWHNDLKLFVQQKIDEKSLLAKADNICKKSEALYSIGIINLLNGNETIAKKYFQDTVNLKVYSYTEYIHSKYYIKNLK